MSALKKTVPEGANSIIFSCTMLFIARYVSVYCTFPLASCDARTSVTGVSVRYASIREVVETSLLLLSNSNTLQKTSSIITYIHFVYIPGRF